MALKNNPRISQSQHQAKAYEEVTREFRAAYLPAVTGNITAVGADSGSRLAAGALNNPVVYDHVGTGVTLNQLITDFGRTRTLVRSAALNANAEQQAVNSTKADVVLQPDAAYLGVLRARSLLAVAQERFRRASLWQTRYRHCFKTSLNLHWTSASLM